MKYHIQALGLLLTFLLLSNSAFSNGLPIYRTYAPVKLIENKKPVFYKNEMNKLQKASKYEGALCYAFLAIKYGKRPQVKKSEKFLAEHFDNNLKMVGTSIENLKKQTEVFTDELSAQAASQLWCHYKNMVWLKELADEHGGAYKVSEYSDQAAKTEQVKADYFKKTAQMYFDEALAAEPAAASKNDYKPLARKLRRALKYENRQDILDLYGKVKKLATTTFGVGKATDRVTNSSVVVGEIRSVLYSEIKNSISRNSIPFLELLPNDISTTTANGAEFVVEIVAENRNIQTSKETPDTEDVEKKKEVGEGDAKRVETYKAKFTTYGKKAEVTLQGMYIIKERATGKTIRTDNITGTYTWSDYWYSYSGSIEALSKSQKRKVEQKESSYPPDGELINFAATGLAEQAGIQVLKYLRDTYK